MRTSTRRRFLGAVGIGAAAGIAGCLGGNADADAPEPTGDTVAELPTPAIGSADASVVVEVYEDFSCPGCREFKTTIAPNVIGEYANPGIIRYEHRDFPLPVDDWSWAVASAARAVQDEADADAFWTFATEIYEHQGSYSLSAIEELGEEIAGVGTSARSAADDLTYVPVVAADKERGLDSGVERTPTVLVDGSSVEPSYSAIAEAIEDAR